MSNICFETNSVFLRNRLSLVRSGLLGLPIEYHSRRANASVMPETRKRPAQKSWRQQGLNLLGSLLILMSLVVTTIVYGPELYYKFVPVDRVPVQATAVGSPQGGQFTEGTEARILALEIESAEQERYLPPQDESLPEGDWLTIPRIGVRTQFNEDEATLSKGVWKVPEYGQPGALTMPIILVAHRFGWDWWWQNDYWRYNSFYLLPNTEPGDRVEIISDQRKWVYEIYAGEEGEEISDYNADMILYTCKFLNSPIRHFRYARLINPDANTQGQNLGNQEVVESANNEVN